MSYCPRDHYVLPADRCIEAVSLFHLAREDAMRAKREIWKEKYGAVGAITGGGTKRNGLVFDGYAPYLEQAEMGGLCKAERLRGGVVAGMPLPTRAYDLDAYVEEGCCWLGRPARNTKRGKEIAADLEYVEELCDIWQWSLENALGIYGTVFYEHAFHKTVAKLLRDGRVIVSAAQNLNRPRGDGLSRNFEASTIPEWAQPISREEYDRLALEADRYEEAA